MTQVDTEYAARTHADAQAIMAKFSATLAAAKAQDSAQYAFSAMASLIAELTGMLKGMAFCDVGMSNEQVDTMFPDIHPAVTEAISFITQKLITTGHAAGARSTVQA